jgi:hypothetical protein
VSEVAGPHRKFECDCALEALACQEEDARTARREGSWILRSIYQQLARCSFFTYLDDQRVRRAVRDSYRRDRCSKIRRRTEGPLDHLDTRFAHLQTRCAPSLSHRP